MAVPQSGATGMQSWSQAAQAGRAVAREDWSEPGASAGSLCLSFTFHIYAIQWFALRQTNCAAQVVVSLLPSEVCSFPGLRAG